MKDFWELIGALIAFIAGVSLAIVGVILVIVGALFWPAIAITLVYIAGHMAGVW